MVDPKLIFADVFGIPSDTDFERRLKTYRGGWIEGIRIVSM